MLPWRVHWNGQEEERAGSSVCLCVCLCWLLENILSWSRSLKVIKTYSLVFKFFTLFISGLYFSLSFTCLFSHPTHLTPKKSSLICSAVSSSFPAFIILILSVINKTWCFLFISLAGTFTFVWKNIWWSDSYLFPLWFKRHALDVKVKENYINLIHSLKMFSMQKLHIIFKIVLR